MAINKDDLHIVGGNLRALFVPTQPGWSLLSADYSQVCAQGLCYMLPSDKLPILASNYSKQLYLCLLFGCMHAR